MPADAKRSNKSSSDIVSNNNNKKRGKNTGTKNKAKSAKGITKTRKTSEEKKMARARGAKASSKNVVKKKKNDVAVGKTKKQTSNTTRGKVDVEDDDSASTSMRSVPKKKSSQQKRKEFNQAASVSTLSFPVSRMMAAFKFFYVKRRSELSGVPQKPKTIQMESDIKYCLNDLVNHTIKQPIGVAKCFSALKNKPTVESSDISSAYYVLNKYGDACVSSI
jgi:hypothetical protein